MNIPYTIPEVPNNQALKHVPKNMSYVKCKLLSGYFPTFLRTNVLYTYLRKKNRYSCIFKKLMQRK